MNWDYREKGLRILAFPCNQFGKQEPGNAEEIWTTNFKNYGANFPFTEKIEVNGPKAHPAYRFLR